jgi:hypothetical protein
MAIYRLIERDEPVTPTLERWFSKKAAKREAKLWNRLGWNLRVKRERKG